ncbi:MAG: ATPase [Hormoscilla sp. GUM202]|nr:ATPase [Hormoscilla sp. GUM202]
MELEDFFNLASDIVYAKTGKHLNDLQQVVLRGILQRHKYSQIARDFPYSEGYVRDVGAELFRILSEELGEKVNKTNLRASLERWRVSNVLHVCKDFNINHISGDVNICGDSLPSSAVPHPPSNEQTPNQDNPRPNVRLDLADAPDVSPFYGRTEELTTLKQWILQERCRLVAVLGMTGIGKTAIAVQLVKQMSDKFDYVIWRSLRNCPVLETFLSNLLQFFSQDGETPDRGDRLSQVMEYLRSYRCLLVVDDLQTIFSSGQLAGHYKDGYEDYRTLWEQVGELSHNSCLLLNSWSPPREIASLAGENLPARSIRLSGLGAAAGEILRDFGLADSTEWETLINTYRGDPLWLKIIATMIKDLFKGSVAEFCNYGMLPCVDLQDRLEQQFRRLSQLEQQVLSAIVGQAEPVSLAQLRTILQSSLEYLGNALLSLERRSLLEKPETYGKETVFSLAPVLREYLQNK